MSASRARLARPNDRFANRRDVGIRSDKEARKLANLREDAMTQLSRRNLLIGAGTASAAAAIGSQLAAPPAHAAAPPAGRQAPAFYRAKVGDFEVTQLADGARPVPMPQGFVRNVPREQALAAAEAAYMPAGMVTVPFNPVVINTGSELVLIDAGYGPEALPTAGLLPANLAGAGIDVR